ncbi:MAG: 16S rRNA processing protein RimM [Campylobacterales bacterium]|nr:16S rRNA processing protein RimM [Campylobacterales bacterium]
MIDKKPNLIRIAKLGKAFGLKGDIKIYLLTDFPEQFSKNKQFKIKNIIYTIENFDIESGLIKFFEINSPEEAKILTNSFLFSTEEETKKNFTLQDNEYFWFDIIGCEVYENDIFLGSVEDINEFSINYYISIKTSQNLIEKKYPTRFLLPFIDKFIKDVNISQKKIFTNGALDILENS